MTKTTKTPQVNHSQPYIDALKMPLSAKMTKTALVNPKLAKSQTRSKSPQNTTFLSFTSNLSFSQIFGNFDQV